MEFKDFLLSENRAYLDQRISDILSALQDLNDNAENMGTRHVVSNSEKIVNRIRRIIHTHWPEKEEPRLLVLRKCAAAIMRSIENKDDLNSILKKCQSNVEDISGGKKANDI
jgi:hypothetical protein